MRYTLELNIGKLVLEGFSSSERHRISNSIRDELTHIFNERGIPDSLKENRYIDRMNLGKINISSHQKSEMVGNKVAQTIYSSLKNG